MTANRRYFAGIGGALFAIAIGSGCVTNSQFEQALKDRDNEIRSLHEERTALKTKLRELEFQRDSLETALVEAGAQSVQSTPETEERIPELDQVGVSYGTRDGNMVLSVPSEITFASGKAELSKQGRAALDAVARTLENKYPEGRYWIEGHTDSDPILKSKYPTNRDLSLARAMAVLHHLVEESGVDDSRCAVVGWGEYRPVSSNDKADNKARNRRVEIVVHGS